MDSNSIRSKLNHIECSFGEYDPPVFYTQEQANQLISLQTLWFFEPLYHSIDSPNDHVIVHFVSPEHEVSPDEGTILSDQNVNRQVFGFRYVVDNFVVKVSIYCRGGFQQSSRYELRYEVRLNNPATNNSYLVLLASIHAGQGDYFDYFDDDSESDSNILNPTFQCKNFARAQRFFDTVCIDRKLNIPGFAQILNNIADMDARTSWFVEQLNVILSIFANMVATERIGFTNEELDEIVITDNEMITITHVEPPSGIIFVDIPLETI